MQYIPLINHHAIQILTRENWLDLGVEHYAVSLSPLLIKPGLAFWEKQAAPCLKTWLGWPLKLSLIIPDGPYPIKLTSPLDGSKIMLHSGDMEVLLATLKPDEVYTEQSCPAIIHDKPLQLTVNWMIDETQSLQDSDSRETFLPLKADCACPTCSQGLTTAVLHHLSFEVPILAQRYLMMHHIWQALNKRG